MKKYIKMEVIYMTDKTKKFIVITTCSIISVLLIFYIARGLHRVYVSDEQTPSGQGTNDVNVNINLPTSSKNEIDIDVKQPTASQLASESGTQSTDKPTDVCAYPTAPIQPAEISSEPTKTVKTSEMQPTESIQPSETVTQSTKNSEIMQTHQPQVTKPTYSDEQLTNPNQMPNGSKADNGTPETKPTNSSSEPKAGDKKDGKIYIPGFGWVDDEGGGGSGSYDDEMYENGNKIGIMD